MKFQDIGKDAIAEKGWWAAHQWLVLRRISQLSILGLFLLGPLTGLWLIKGNLTSSLILETVPLTDPFVLLQSFAAGHLPEMTALIGAGVVLAFYFLVGGRAYCAWVCPVNLVTDAAFWLRNRLNIRGTWRIGRNTRYWVLAMILVVSFITGTMIWELVNPVSMMHRALFFGVGSAWMLITMIFLFDFLLVKRGWCSHLCPMGAFYALLGMFSPVRIKAVDRAACNDCAECYHICPEPLIIKPVLKGEKHGVGPVILSSACTNCGRCIDICSKRVFQFSTRYSNSQSTPKMSTTPSESPAQADVSLPNTTKMESGS